MYFCFNTSLRIEMLRICGTRKDCAIKELVTARYHLAFLRQSDVCAEFGFESPGKHSVLFEVKVETVSPQE